LAGKSILVVEDEYFVADDLKRALSAQGATVIGPIGQIDRALTVGSEERFDAAVLDVNLEGATTYALADRLAERGIPCLFVTGYDGWAMPEAYRKAPRVAKPFAMQTVIDTIAAIIAGTLAA